ncbi:MAG: insulinase family protein [Acidobacteriota bacterium]|nr:insulinase family protein [Acidobacteriota bacterium]
MFRRLLTGALALFLFAGAGCSRPAPPVQPASDLPKVAFEKYTLPNGLEVILSEDHRLPLVAVNLWYHVGPANEAAGRTGFAHLFEHMMFQGAKHVPGDRHFKLLEGAGASDINGTTDFDRTNYFETLPSNELALALWLESDRMGYLPDMLDQANLSNQQDVVRNERRQSVENRPYGIVEEAMYHELFPKTHPYYADVIGSHADIQAAKLEDVQAFFREFYTPNNASLAIVGDIDPAATKALVEKYFGPLERGPAVKKPDVRTPPITSERRLVVQDRVELPRVYMAWITPPAFTQGDADADLAGMILGGGKSSRLYEKLVYEKQIAQTVRASQESLALGSVFEIEVTARPGHTAEEMEKAIQEELDTFRRDGPTAAELEQARNGIETRSIRALERLGGFGGVADRLNMYNQYLGTPDYFAQDLGRYAKATPDSIRTFAQQQLQDSARVVVYGVPGTPDLGTPVPTPKPDAAALAKKGGQPVNADAAWRNTEPVPGPVRPLKVAAPVSFTLGNGLTVILSQRPGLPLVAANLVVRTGSDANPVDRPGLASFTVAMLDEGTTSRSALQLADDVARLGATLTTGSTVDASRVSVASLKKTFPQALGLLADVALHPSLPAAEVERQRKERLASLVQQRENPSAVANATMFSALYGNRHPYGFTELGTEGALQAISRDDMMAFWRANFVPNNAALVVAGDITEGDLRALAEQTFGTWQRGTPAHVTLGPPSTDRARIIVVDKPGAAQTQVRVAAIGAPRSTPDYAPLSVMNMSLGGLFSSRINLNLREEHGYTYGAFTQFVFRKAAGPFLVASGIRTDVTGPAVGEIFKEIRRMDATPLSDAELALARDALVRSLPAEFETGTNVVASFSNIYVYDLGLDYFTKYPGLIGAVTAADVQRVAKAYLVPDRMIVIAVGDRATIVPQLKKLNLGSIELRDADGRIQH